MLFKTAILLTINLVCLAACAAELQTPNATLVGSYKGKPQYSISGYTLWGEMSKQDAINKASKYMNLMCSQGAELIDVQTFDASRMGHHQLGWTAIFICTKLGNGSGV